MRHQDWPERLAAVIDAAGETPFAWGSHDCCLFVCDCVEAMTGLDPAAPFRGEYDTRVGAYRRMSEFVDGGIGHVKTDDLVEATAERITGELNAQELARPFAGRGDVVLLSEQDGDMLGIIWSGAVYLVSEDGLTIRSLSAIRRAWRF